MFYGVTLNYLLSICSRIRLQRTILVKILLKFTTARRSTPLSLHAEMVRPFDKICWKTGGGF
jgi:hypothetical protein